MLYKPNKNHADEMINLFQRIFEDSSKNNEITFGTDTLHYGMAFLLILSEYAMKLEIESEFQKLQCFLDPSRCVID